MLNIGRQQVAGQHRGGGCGVLHHQVDPRGPGEGRLGAAGPAGPVGRCWGPGEG